MGVSFKDYVIISDAFQEAQLEEGAIWDAIQKKLGAKASPEETEAQLDRLKKIAPAEFAKIKAAEKAKGSTAQDKIAAQRSAEFEKRKALRPIGGNIKTQGTQGTRGSGDERYGDRRAAEHAYAMGEEVQTSEPVLLEDTEKMFIVHVPANVYAGKYYDFRTAEIKVMAKDEDEASSLVNKHKDDVLRMLKAKRVAPSGRPLLPAREEASKNVFFKKDYYVKPIESTGGNNVLTRHGGFKRVTLDKIEEAPPMPLSKPVPPRDQKRSKVKD